VTIPKVYSGKDHTFFFVSYAGSRKRGATDTLGVQIPTPANLTGDFSNLVDNRGTLRRIYDLRDAGSHLFPGSIEEVWASNDTDPKGTGNQSSTPVPSLAHRRITRGNLVLAWRVVHVLDRELVDHRLHLLRIAL